MVFHPSTITPALAEDRLQLLAATIAQARADAREGHEPEKGDDAWTFGCRAYRRTCFAFQRLAESGEYPWLVVEEHGLAFTLLLDGEPLKFYRGDAENPSSRSLRRGLDEAIRQGKLSFFEDELAAGDGWFWLLAIETHDDGSVLRIAVFQANENKETRNLYFIPMDTPVSALSPITYVVRDGVDLEPPLVTPKTPQPTKEEKLGASDPS